MANNPLYPKLTAITGGDPRLIAKHSGERAYFPSVVGPGGYEELDRMAINLGGCNGCQQPGDDGLEPFDRLALLFAAAPELLAACDAALSYVKLRTGSSSKLAAQLEAAIGKAKKGGQP